MAEAPRNPQPYGYDEDFVDAVEDDFQCSICHLPLKEPVLTRCGHRFCKECLEEHFRSQEAQEQPTTCPADREGLDRDRGIFPDKATERKILSFAIKCPSEDCEWTGELRSKEVHLASCLFKLVHCTNENCHMTIQRRELEEHVTVNCTWRILACDHCSEQHPECNMKKHFDICREYPVVCTNKCGRKDIPREKLEVHIRDECPATEVQCEYKSLGCEAVFPRSDAKSHSRTHIESHLNLTLRGLKVTQHEVHELITMVKDQSQQMDRMISKDKEQTRQIERQSQQIERQSQQIERLISKEKEQSQEIGRLSERIERLMSKDKLTPFEWKIHNINAFFAQASKVVQRSVSEPFYLFARGYKYLLRIENKWSLYTPFLFVYIKVVPGEFDELLSWPCKEKVRVMLVDQDLLLDDRKNISRVIDFGAEHCSRPLHDHHHEYRLILQLGRFRFRSCIKDDTVLIRVNGE